MTGKDMIKVLLISYGFDKDIKIDGGITADGSYLYDVEAYNCDGEGFSGCDYFLGMIISINEYMDKLRHPESDALYLDGSKVEPVDTSCYFRLRDLPVSKLMDDKFRNEFLEKNRQADKEHKEYCDYMAPTWKEDEDARPCTNCQDNPKDLDLAFYRCSKHYYMTCDKLKKWMNDCTERDRAATEEWNRMKGEKK